MLGRMQLANLQMEFVASVSHELRTPLAVIRSAADNIADGLVKNMDALHRYGVILQHQSRSMGELVDQILLFASTEDRNKRVSLQPLAVEQIVETVLSDTEVLVRDAGFTLDLEVDPALASGVLCASGQLTNEAVAEALGRRAVPPLEALGPGRTPKPG